MREGGRIVSHAVMVNEDRKRKVPDERTRVAEYFYAAGTEIPTGATVVCSCTAPSTPPDWRWRAAMRLPASSRFFLTASKDSQLGFGKSDGSR